jgi:uncharacterized RDD family membrane protein YckC
MEFLPIGVRGHRVYAGFWKRLCAVLIDGLILFPVFVLVHWLGGFDKYLAILITIPSYGLFAMYNVYFNAKFGGTIGKLGIGICITKPDGGKIGWIEAWKRSSVDLLFSIIVLCAQIWVLLQVNADAYIKASFIERLQILQPHYPSWFPVVSTLKNVWILSEVIVLLLNRRKRAIHDFIAGTVVIHKEFAKTPPDVEQKSVGFIQNKKNLFIAISCCIFISLVILFAFVKTDLVYQEKDLIKLLQSPSSMQQIRGTCIVIDNPNIERYDKKQVIELLIKLLSSSDETVKGNAMCALGKLGPSAKECVPTLIKLLDDPSLGVQEHAILALGEIKSAPNIAVPALIKYASRDNKNRWLVYRSLSNFGPEAKDALPHIKSSLGHPDENVRIYANHALKSITKDQSGKPELE